MRRFAPSIALAFTLVAGPASAQGTVDSRLAARLDPGTRTAVVAIIDSARSASLPVEPLVDKALEGAAKRASSQQIVSAVRTFASQLMEARRALGTTSTEPELLGGAQAIRAGIPVQHLEKLRRARSGVQIATALTVTSDLVNREVPIDTAVAVVSALLERAATDEQLLGLRAEIETDILGGQAPVLAASRRGQTLEQTLAATPPNGAGNLPALPSSGTIRTGDGAMPKPPGSAVGTKLPSAPSKPPVQRKRP